MRKIARRKSPRVTMMRQEIEKLKTQSALPRLLQAFAGWYLSHEAKQHGGQVKPAEKRRFQHIVEIVGQARFIPRIAAVSTNATFNQYAQQCNSIATANAARSR